MNIKLSPIAHRKIDRVSKLLKIVGVVYAHEDIWLKSSLCAGETYYSSFLSFRYMKQSDKLNCTTDLDSMITCSMFILLLLFDMTGDMNCLIVLWIFLPFNFQMFVHNEINIVHLVCTDSECSGHRIAPRSF